MRHKVQGGTVLLFIDPTGGTDYDTVVCLTEVTKADAVAVIDSASACGPDNSPGALQISYTFTGQLVQDPDAGEISGTNLRVLLRAKTTVGFKIAPVTPVDGDEIEIGTGFFSAIGSTYAFNSNGTFTGTLNPYGTPAITIEGS